MHKLRKKNVGAPKMYIDGKWSKPTIDGEWSVITCTSQATACKMMLRGWERVDDAAAVVSAPATEEPQDLDGMAYKELQAMARARGLPASGKRSELLERLESMDS